MSNIGVDHMLDALAEKTCTPCRGSSRRSRKRKPRASTSRWRPGSSEMMLTALRERLLLSTQAS
jgi:hypothetical protein